jgi:hypothetical protein
MAREPAPAVRLSENPNPEQPTIVQFTEDWWKENTASPEGLRTVYEIINSHIESHDALTRRVSQQETQIDALIEERDQLSIELFSTLRANQNREQSPAPIANTKSKSTKIPDPPTLIDGQSPTFESWLSKIKNKLRVNARKILLQLQMRYCSTCKAFIKIQTKYSMLRTISRSYS